MERGDFVIVLEPNTDPYYMQTDDPDSIIREKIGNMRNHVWIGEDRKVALYLDDSACTYNSRLRKNREVQGIGKVHGSMVIVNTYTEDYETDICGFTIEDAQAVLNWADLYTKML